MAASATTRGSSQLKVDTHRSLTRTTSSNVGHFNTPSGIKKTSVCLQTKFQLVSVANLWQPPGFKGGEGGGGQKPVIEGLRVGGNQLEGEGAKTSYRGRGVISIAPPLAVALNVL